MLRLQMLFKTAGRIPVFGCFVCDDICSHSDGVPQQQSSAGTFTPPLFTLAFPDAITSIPSSAKSQSLQRAPLTRPGPGSTAQARLPGRTLGPVAQH
eukprot:363265-Chlamydomonas_euryale.AAC.5